MYNSPNYAKKRNSGSGSVSPVSVIDIVAANFLVPVYEPLMAEDELVLSLDGDLMIAKSAEVPLIQLP